MRPTLSLRWLRHPRLPRLSRWNVAGIFMLGSVTGMTLMHCAEPPPPAQYPIDCQALVFAEFIGDHPRILHGEAFTLAIARDLVRSIRRCAGKDTAFDSDTADPFGVGGSPGPLDHDAGHPHDIYRSLP